MTDFMNTAEADERVRAALEQLVRAASPELVRLVRRMDRSLSTNDVRSGLSRLSDIRPSSLGPGPSGDALAAYREIERYCLELEPDAVRPQLWKPSVNISFLKGSRRFCDVSVFTGGMRVRLKRESEVAVHTVLDLESAKPLIREAFLAA